MSFQTFSSINCVETYLLVEVDCTYFLSNICQERRNNMALTGRITGKAAGYNQTSHVTISFLTDDEKELKSSINLQVSLI